MSEAAWKILALFFADHKRNRPSYYLASWHLKEALGVEIDAAHVKIAPRNEYEQALHDLIELGIMEEMPNLGERFHLIVKEK